MLFILNNSEERQFAHYIIDIVIRNIADRVPAGEPEPDVDNFEDQYPQNESGDSSPNGSPAPSPSRVPLPPSPQQMVRID